MDINSRVHFMGIGGIGMSGIAQMLYKQGWQISGCDAYDTEMVKRLRSIGIPVSVGHQPEHILEIDALVITAAIKPDNPELLAAQAAGVQILRRSEALDLLMRSQQGLAVTGTHGKTTTTGMLAAVLEGADLDPSVVIGGDVRRYGGNWRLGSGQYVVVEACEAYGSFLDLHPFAAIVTNVEADHLDYYHTEQNMMEAYHTFLSQVSPDGVIVVPSEDAKAVAVSIGHPARMVTVGESEASDYCWRPTRQGICLRDSQMVWHTMPMHVFGLQNKADAALAVAMGLELGLTPDQAASGLALFHGVDRRQQFIGHASGVDIYDDYAHHPTEIEAVLRSFREVIKGRLVVAFQPHLFSRTADFFQQFASGLANGADELVLVDIYPARERAEDFPGISSSSLSDAVRLVKPSLPVTVVDTPLAAVEAILKQLKPADTLVTLGAGELNQTAMWVYEALSRAEKENGGS
ncbi:MAG: UDP-N-acetylmuramate--L-alanine ligase [Armatimonadota bacterium]